MPEPNTGCWIWLGACDAKGYGRVGQQHGAGRAYRAMYEQMVGPIPDGLHLDHLCRNKWCVNPEHLEPVTNRENVIRGPRVQMARGTDHCRHGHPWSVANTYIHPRSGSRVCRACTAKVQAEYLKRKVA